MSVERGGGSAPAAARQAHGDPGVGPAGGSRGQRATARVGSLDDGGPAIHHRPPQDGARSARARVTPCSEYEPLRRGGQALLLQSCFGVIAPKHRSAISARGGGSGAGGGEDRQGDLEALAVEPFLEV